MVDSCWLGALMARKAEECADASNAAEHIGLEGLYLGLISITVLPWTSQATITSWCSKVVTSVEDQRLCWIFEAEHSKHTSSDGAATNQMRLGPT